MTSMGKEKKQIIQEIQNLLERIDLDGLSFLKDQASVLVYNQNVQKRNDEATHKQASEKSDQNKVSKEKESKSEMDHGFSPVVTIEQVKKGKNFILCIHHSRLFMDVDEIKALLHIADTADNSKTASSRLYRWFKKERNDIIIDGNIRSSESRVLSLIYQELIDNFSMNTHS